MKYLIAASMLLAACDTPSNATKTSAQVQREGYLQMDPHKDSELCQYRCKEEYESCLITALSNANSNRYSFCQRRKGDYDSDDSCLRYGLGKEEDECVLPNRGSCLNKCYNRFNMIFDLQKAAGTYKEPTSTSP